jgi:hypothetical protein
MDPRRQLVADSLAAAVSQIDEVLGPWGFSFAHGGIERSHCGPFACGHFRRGQTGIGISCRETIDNLNYEHTFITKHRYCQESEHFDIGHNALMSALGHMSDCRLITIDDIPDAIVARDGGDRVAALIYDLSTIAAAVLREPCEEFFTIIRSGRRCYSMTPIIG